LHYLIARFETKSQSLSEKTYRRLSAERIDRTRNHYPQCKPKNIKSQLHPKKDQYNPKKTSTLLEDDPTSRRTNNQSEESRSLLEENPRDRRSKKKHTHTHTHNNNKQTIIPQKTFKEEKKFKEKSFDYFPQKLCFYW
jgi:hypothetical protein